MQTDAQNLHSHRGQWGVKATRPTAQFARQELSTHTHTHRGRYFKVIVLVGVLRPTAQPPPPLFGLLPQGHITALIQFHVNLRVNATLIRQGSWPVQKILKKGSCKMANFRRGLNKVCV